MPADPIVAPTPAAPSSHLAAERTVHRAALAAPPSGGRRPVLVVDASAIARKFLVQRLAALGYCAHGVDSGEQALQMIEREPFTIVFVELALPATGLDGLGLCQAIKRRTAHPGGVAPAVVVATGQLSASDRVRGSLAGCDAYLTKPLTEASFAAALGEVDPLFR